MRRELKVMTNRLIMKQHRTHSELLKIVHIDPIDKTFKLAGGPGGAAALGYISHESHRVQDMEEHRELKQRFLFDTVLLAGRSKPELPSE